MEKIEFKGTIIPIGGNEDKGSGPNEMYTHDFIQQGILANVVKESGGNKAQIVVITTASRIPIVAVTGTNGKTTTTRLMAHMVKMKGFTVGYTTTDGIYVQNHLMMSGDCSGPGSA